MSWRCELCQEHLTNTQIHECRYKKETAVGFRFTRAHFPVCDFVQCNSVETANIANAALDKYLSECPVVYSTGGITSDGRGECSWDIFSREPVNAKSTHRAVLFNVEKIEKKCTHEPAINPLSKKRHHEILRETMYKNICAKCGVKLTATWKAEGE